MSDMCAVHGKASAHQITGCPPFCSSGGGATAVRNSPVFGFLSDLERRFPGADRESLTKAAASDALEDIAARTEMLSWHIESLVWFLADQDGQIERDDAFAKAYEHMGFCVDALCDESKKLSEDAYSTVREHQKILSRLTV